MNLNLLLTIILLSTVLAASVSTSVSASISDGDKPAGACCDGPPTASQLHPVLGIRRIAKITLATPDLDASEKWWAKAFGFEASQPRFTSKFGTVQRMTLFNWLTIELVSSQSGTTKNDFQLPNPYAHTTTHGMITQFSFRVTSNADALAELKKRGVGSAVGAYPIYPNPTVELKLSFVRDPTTGALIELLEPMDVALTTTDRVPDWLEPNGAANPLGILGFQQVSSCVQDVETSMKWHRHVLGTTVPHGYGYVDLTSSFGTIIGIGRNDKHLRLEHIQNQTSVGFQDKFGTQARAYPNQCKTMAGIVSYAVTVTSMDLEAARDEVSLRIRNLPSRTNPIPSTSAPTPIYTDKNYGSSFFVTDPDGILIEVQGRTRSPLGALQQHVQAINSHDVARILTGYAGFPSGGEGATLELINTATKQSALYGRGQQHSIESFWQSFFGTGYDATQCGLPLVGGPLLRENGFWIGWQCPRYGISVGSDDVTFDDDNLIANQAVYLHWPGMNISRPEKWELRDAQSTWKHHVTSLLASDAAQTAEDYEEHAVLVTVNNAAGANNNRTYEGRKAIQSYWAALFDVFDMTKCGTTAKDVVVTDPLISVGDAEVFAWSSCVENGVVTLADTLSLGGGRKVRHQSMVFDWPGMDMRTLKKTTTPPVVPPPVVPPTGDGGGVLWVVFGVIGMILVAAFAAALALFFFRKYTRGSPDSYHGQGFVSLSGI